MLNQKVGGSMVWKEIKKAVKILLSVARFAKKHPVIFFVLVILGV